MPTVLERCLGTIRRHSPTAPILLDATTAQRWLGEELPARWHKLDSWANKVDFLRPRILHEHGGLFLDLDVVVFRSLQSYFDLLGGADLLCEVVPQGPSVGLLAAPARSAILRRWAQLQVSALAGEESWGFLGTPLLAQAVTECSGDVVTMKAERTRPFPWTEAKRFLDAGRWYEHAGATLPLCWPLYWSQLGAPREIQGTLLDHALSFAEGPGSGPLSDRFWEKRYALGGNSGPGSYGRVAAWKARVVDEFLAEVKPSVIEDWGCGDGHQASLLSLPENATYLGLDVSMTTLDRLGRAHYGDPTRRFQHIRSFWHRPREPADVALSLEVLFHLVDEADWARYLDELFGESSTATWVVVLSNDADHGGVGEHVAVRPFVDYVNERYGERYEFDRRIQSFDSRWCFSDFWIWRRRPTDDPE